MIASKAYQIAVARELGSRSLWDFVQMAWPLVEPSPLVPNWHHEEVCAHLEAVSRVDIRNLVINEPPGCTKSLLVNVFWPGWEWINRPGTKFIYASFDQSLVGKRDGTKLLNLLASEWFRERWGNLLVEKNPSANDFNTNRGGFRFCTSPGGKGTGRHGNINCFDDPSKPKDVAEGGAVTKKALKNVLDWHANTMSSRKADPETHRNVYMMQRLHNSDLAGEILRKGRCVHLCFPMRFVSSLKCQTRFGGDRRDQEGQLLFPQRFGPEEVQVLEEEMGPEVAAAQLQQRPTIAGGGIFRRSWWRFWAKDFDREEPCVCDDCVTSYIQGRPGNREHRSGRMCQMLPSAGLDIQSWDFTFKGKADSDFVAGGALRAYGGRIFLLDMINERLRFTGAQNAMLSMSRKWPTTTVKLVEDAANGPAIEDSLKHEIPGIVLVSAAGGHVARANAATPALAAEKVFLPLPEVCPLVWTLIGQAEAFPKDANDDLVDMFSHGVNHLKGAGANLIEAMRKVRQ